MKLAMLAAALLLKQLGWTFWERQVPIWAAGTVAAWLTLWRCAAVTRADE